MTMQDPENTHVDHPIEDSGIHIRDTDRAPATGWQITMVAALIVAILCVFFYGLTSQRTVVAGANRPNTNIAAPLGHATQSATTGQGTADSARPRQPAPNAAAPHATSGAGTAPAR